MRSAASSGAMRRQHAAASAVRPAPYELDLVLGVQLLEHVRLEFAVLAHRLDDLLALVVGAGLDQVGDLGRVELGSFR